MVFVPETWEDYPSTATPITAAQLNRMEAGIYAAHSGSGGGSDVDKWRSKTPEQLFATYGIITVGDDNLCTYDVDDYADVATALETALAAHPYTTIHYIGGNAALGSNLTAVSYGDIDFHGAVMTIDACTIGIDASAASYFTVRNVTLTLASHAATNTIIGIKTGAGGVVENVTTEWLYTGIQINGADLYMNNIVCRYGIDTGIDTISSTSLTNLHINKVYLYSQFSASYGFNTAGVRVRAGSSVTTSNNIISNITAVDIHGPVLNLYYIGGNRISNIMGSNVWNECILGYNSRFNVGCNIITTQDPSNGTATSPGISLTTCAENVFSNLDLRYTKGPAILMQTTSSRNNFNNLFIYGGPITTTPQGIKIDSGCHGNSFSTFMIRDIAGDAIVLTSANRNGFVDGECYNNTGAGIDCVNANENTASAVRMITGHSYGILESGTSDYNKFDGCLIKSYVTAAALLVGTNSEISNCYGYNPVGNVTAPAVPSSGTSWTNTFHVNLDVFIYGGTVSAIKVSKSGGTLLTTGLTSGRFTLAPGSVINITYSSAPTWVMGEF